MFFSSIQQVTGIVGRAETLSSVFFLLAFIFYVKASLEKENRLNGEYELMFYTMQLSTVVLLFRPVLFYR